LWIFGLVASSIHRGLQACYGANVVDGYRRECLRRAEIIVCTEQPDIEYSVWWAPRDMPMPELADYRALKRAVCCEYARITNRPDLLEHFRDLHWDDSAAAIANRDRRLLPWSRAQQDFRLPQPRSGLPFLPGPPAPKH
jgi:hypothetical protein